MAGIRTWHARPGCRSARSPMCCPASARSRRRPPPGCATPSASYGTPDASAQKMRGIRNQILAVQRADSRRHRRGEVQRDFLQQAWRAKNTGYDVLLLSGEDAVDDIRRVARNNMVDGVLLLDIVEDDKRVVEVGLRQALRGHRLSGAVRRLRVRGHRLPRRRRPRGALPAWQRAPRRHPAARQ